MNPLLKWPGGKRWLVPELVKLIPAGTKRIVEPFAGGAALFFHLEPTDIEYVLSDTNEHLIRFYRTVGLFPATFLETFAPLRSRNTPEDYYAIRQAFNGGLDDCTNSAYWLYMNKTGYNGLVRFNKSGGFNTPFGRYPKPSFPTEEEVMKASELLLNKTVHVSHYEHVIYKYAAPETVVYLDPPYYGQFDQYGKRIFTAQDHEWMALVIKRYSAQGVRFILSNAYTPETASIFSFMNIRQIERQQSIAGTVSGRGRTVEMLATSW